MEDGRPMSCQRSMGPPRPCEQASPKHRWHLFSHCTWMKDGALMRELSQIQRKSIIISRCFRDKHARKLVAVRQATQFKGAFKGRFLSVFDNTLRMIPDKVFKLDYKFDFLIAKQHVYILHPLAFDRIAEIEEYASARAHHLTLALGTAVKFMDFTELADFVAGHKRAARLVSALTSRNDLRSIKTALFIKAAHETGVKLKRTGTKIVPDKGSELGCLEMLDDRRYTTALRSGAKPAFVASGRRRI